MPASQTEPGRPEVLEHLAVNIANLNCVIELVKSSSELGRKLNLPLDLLRPGPLLCKHERRQGNGNGKLPAVMADFIEFPSLREAGHGIHRQSIEV
jgi:hypothetical protein